MREREGGNKDVLKEWLGNKDRDLRKSEGEVESESGSGTEKTVLPREHGLETAHQAVNQPCSQLALENTPHPPAEPVLSAD